MTIRICGFCSQEFVVTRHYHKYCSGSCRKEAYLIRSRTRGAAKVNLSRICVGCGIHFAAGRKDKVYCSRRCYNKNYNVKHQSPTPYERGRFAIFERDDFRCIYCGRTSYGDAARLHIDHVLAKSDGGTDTADNLVTACKKCNLEKGATDLQEPEQILIEVRERNQARGISPNTLIKDIIVN